MRDGHATIYTSPNQELQSPFYSEIIDNRVFVTNAELRTELQAGDEILSINSIKVNGLPFYAFLACQLQQTYLSKIVFTCR